MNGVDSWDYWRGYLKCDESRFHLIWKKKKKKKKKKNNKNKKIKIKKKK